MIENQRTQAENASDKAYKRFMGFALVAFITTYLSAPAVASLLTSENPKDYNFQVNSAGVTCYTEEEPVIRNEIDLIVEGAYCPDFTGRTKFQSVIFSKKDSLVTPISK